MHNRSACNCLMCRAFLYFLDLLTGFQCLFSFAPHFAMPRQCSLWKSMKHAHHLNFLLSRTHTDYLCTTSPVGVSPTHLVAPPPYLSRPCRLQVLQNLDKVFTSATTTTISLRQTLQCHFINLIFMILFELAPVLLCDVHKILISGVNSIPGMLCKHLL